MRVASLYHTTLGGGRPPSTWGEGREREKEEGKGDWRKSRMRGIGGRAG